MSLPTLAQIKALADAWWLETPPPAVPHLDVLAARVAALFSSPRACVRLKITNTVGVYALSAELEILESTPGAGDGQLVTRAWQPSSARAQQDLADVYDPSRGRSMRQDGAS